MKPATSNRKVFFLAVTGFFSFGFLCNIAYYNVSRSGDWFAEGTLNNNRIDPVIQSKEKDAWAIVQDDLGTSPAFPSNSSLTDSAFSVQPNKTKKILFWGGFYGGTTLSAYCITKNAMEFCPYNCEYSTNPLEAMSADAFVLNGREGKYIKRPDIYQPHQRLIFLLYESPANSWTKLTPYKSFFNWTMTYRRDSDVPIPYGRVFPKTDEEQLQTLNLTYLPDIKDIQRKKPIAWAVSNCDSSHSDRITLVKYLSALIPVDIYGACGNHSCIKGHRTVADQCTNPNACHAHLATQYKFYLAFENSICKDYVTEKFFNSLKFGMIPVVFGPDRTFYNELAPPTSFIHINDFASLKELAEHLILLDRNVTEYLKYFEWRKYWRLDEAYYFQRGWCSLCQKLHETSPSETKVYENIHRWWHMQDDPQIKGKPCQKYNFTKGNANYVASILLNS